MFYGVSMRKYLVKMKRFWQMIQVFSQNVGWLHRWKALEQPRDNCGRRPQGFDLWPVRANKCGRVIQSSPSSFFTSCSCVLPSPSSVCMFIACHSGSIFPCLAIQRSCHSWMSAQPLNLALLWARDWPSWTPTVPSNINT